MQSIPVSHPEARTPDAAALPHTPVCLNCATALRPDDRYCYHCGQAAVDRRQPLRKLLAAWWDDEVSLDGKLVRSLWLLLRRPGDMSLRFNLGQRKRFTDPLRLYLLLAVVYLFAFQRQVSTLALQPDADTQAQLARMTPEQRYYTEAVSEAYQMVVRDQAEWLFLLSVPLFALELLWMYRRADPLYVNHLVSALHMYAGMYLIGFLTNLLSPFVAAQWAAWMLDLGLFVMYMWLHLRHLYPQVNAGGHAWRIVVLTVLSTVMSMLVTLLMGMANLTYLLLTTSRP